MQNQKKVFLCSVINWYYKTNKEDGYLYFQTPNPYLEGSLCYTNQGHRWKHSPQEGKLLLFPGWLKHGVTTNETEDTRISISFNIIFHRNNSTGTTMKWGQLKNCHTKSP